MFCDKTTVKFIGGRGGDGCVSFRREKFVAKGGPDGGDGGNGGNIILRASSSINTLSQFNRYKKFTAEHGTAGAKQNQTGKTGEDLIIPTPPGTTLIDHETKEVIADLKQPGEEFIIARGGKGGLGNARFKTSIHQAPKFAEHGEKGEEIIIDMELKVVADVGIIGLPSAGKSTLISKISNAKPKIAAYHFTTLIPNLGVVEMPQFGGSKDQTFVIADIPGLIPGAHEGKGLGHEFLRHISRTHILVHLLDGTQPNILENFDNINKELELYDKTLDEETKISEEEQIVVINKIDSIDPKEIKAQIKQLEKAHPELKNKIHTTSAILGENLKDLVWTIWEKREKLLESQAKDEEENQKELDEASEHKTFRPHLERRKQTFKITLLREKEVRPSEEFQYIGEDNRPRKQKTFQLAGHRIEQLANMTDWENYEAIERLYRYMRKTGIQKSLKKEGAETGDIIFIGKHQIKFRR